MKKHNYSRPRLRAATSGRFSAKKRASPAQVFHIHSARSFAFLRKIASLLAPRALQACAVTKKLVMPGLIAVVLLNGCAQRIYTEAKQGVAQTQQQIQVQSAAAHKAQPAVVVKDGFYLNMQPTALENTPSWLKRRVSLQAREVPFSVLMNRLLRQSQSTASYDPSVKPDQLVTMRYSGNLKGALDALAAKTSYHYQINGQAVSWSAFIDKTFNVSFMPGSSHYLVGQSRENQQAQGMNASFNTNIGGAATNPSMMNEQQYSSLEGELSVWKDLRNTLSELKSKDGRFYVSESTTSVTVHDHPENVHAIGQYIAQLNHSLSQQVGIKVEVLEVELNDQFNFGIDWNLLSKNIFNNNDIKLKGNLGSATQLIASAAMRGGLSSAAASLEIGKTIIQALGQQGKVRVVTKPEVVTMNNQIAAIRITQNTGYLQSVSSTSTGAVGNITTSVTPGSVTDGFTLYLLPKIQNEKVYLQISSVLSNLVSLQNINLSSGSSSQSSYNAIEVPKITEKSFNQRSVLENGSTLVIAGYKQLRDALDGSSLFGISPLGGKSATKRNIETLVLITPTIIRSS